ncbi:MAG: ABC transporter ATP-binding protein [Candidatus Competibacterales bacterium]
MIQVDHLTVSYGSAPALAALSFAVPQGGSFGLVGESGSGKSTALKALVGLAQAEEGRLQVARCGVDMRRTRRPQWFYRRVQMVFQDPYAALHPRHSVDRALGEPVRVQGLNDVEGRVKRALEAVGLDHRFRFRYPHQLSGGQRQRVAIARALVVEPQILLLDEPTSALDVSVQAEVLNTLQALRASRGLTYVLVSHNLAVVAHLCQHLAVLRQGGVVETLTREQLVAQRSSHPYTRALLAASHGFRRPSSTLPSP